MMMEAPDSSETHLNINEQCQGPESIFLNPLNAELNPICHLLALLGAHHILHVSGIRVKDIEIFHHGEDSCCVLLNYDIV